jgi:two-component system, NtrC family, nitrogen regulation sensor histidine kinase NtrY
MSFRTRLLISFSVAVILTAGLVTWIVSSATRRAFEQRDEQRTAALVAQFRREFARRGEEVVQRVEGVADTEGVLRMAIELSRPDADAGPYVNEAQALAATHGLDFLELIAYDGAIVSSAQWPARFGYKAEWVAQPEDWKASGAFLKAEELPDEAALALVAVRAVGAGDRNLYVVGGLRLDRQFLASLPLPAGMRALLYRNFEPRFSAQLLAGVNGPVAGSERLEPLIDRVRARAGDAAETVDWPDSPETFQAMPLLGRENDLLGVLLVGSSRRDLVALVAGIRRTGALAATLGILLGAALSFWAARRITLPLERLAEGARTVASGDWHARVEIASRDEIGELASAFNSMTLQLVEQRDRLVQAERVAAWRELARRLAHELKNPLFPLQITIENLQRAKEQAPEQFDEVFRESSGTLLAELANLKKIIGRFSDFAKMPPPQLERVDVNELVRRTMRLFEAQFQAQGRPPIAAEIECAEDAGTIEADPEQLGRALQNMALNAIDAMPGGGTLRVRTARHAGAVEIEISDTGEGLTPEECERLFTPYYTTKLHGTGLGLAIVQSVVADHKGKIAVESAPGTGTTFRIELPEKA